MLLVLGVLPFPDAYSQLKHPHPHTGYRVGYFLGRPQTHVKWGSSLQFYHPGEPYNSLFLGNR